MNRDKTCDVCKYFDMEDVEAMTGICRIRSVPGEFPRRGTAEWCGEFKHVVDDITDIDNPYLTSLVEEMKFSTRTSNIFHSMSIKTIADIVKYSEKEFMRAPGLGSTTLNEIKEKLDRIGLKLKLRPDEG